MNHFSADTAAKLQLVKDHIGTFADFPRPGIVFRDIFTALANGKVCSALKDLLIDHIRTSCSGIDVVVALDARGFLFGFMLAAELGIPFVPVRKKGKLPGKCLSHEYNLEYGTDVFEIQAKSITPGQKVVIVDDLLATGGSLKAACELIQQTGGIVTEIIVVIELKSLNGRSKIPKINTHSFLQYD